jgi:hypothetical protein
MGIVIAYLLGFLTALKAPTNQSINTVSTQDAAANKSAEAPKHVPISPEATPAQKNNNKACYCKPDMTPWWKMILEAAAVCIGLSVAIIYYRQLDAMQRQFREMQEQTRLQRQTGINTERAWVGLDVPITLDRIDAQGEHIRIRGHYSIKNFGHGPAFKVMQSGSFIENPSQNLHMTQKEADFSCSSSIAFATGTVPVGGTMTQPPPFGYTLFPDQPHNELIDYQGTVSSTNFFQFIGCVAYIDQFNQVHWTRFCMWRKPGDIAKVPKLEFCSMFNDTDKPKD